MTAITLQQDNYIVRKAKAAEVLNEQLNEQKKESSYFHCKCQNATVLFFSEIISKILSNTLIQ